MTDTTRTAPFDANTSTTRKRVSFAGSMGLTRLRVVLVLLPIDAKVELTSYDENPSNSFSCETHVNKQRSY